MPLTPQAKQYVSHALLLSSQLCFSGWHIVGSLAMKDGASPFVFALYRELLAAAMMFIIAKFIMGQKLYILPEDRVRFLILGFFSFVNVVGAMLSLDYISATRFAIFQPCIPCIATLISVIVGLESFTLIKAAGVAVAVSGAILTEAWKEGGDGGDDDEKDVVLGSIIVSLQVTAMACLVVFAKPILPKYHSAVTTFFYYSIGTAFTVVLFAALSYSFTASDLYFNGSLLPWLGLAYASTFATVYTYNALSWGGRQLTPSTTTVYSTFQPVGTMILSFFILDDVVTTPEFVGAALVVVGLGLTVYGQNFENLHNANKGADVTDPLDDEKDLLAEHYRVSERTNLTNDTNIGIGGVTTTTSEHYLDEDFSFHSRTVSLSPNTSHNPPKSRTSFPYYYDKLLPDDIKTKTQHNPLDTHH